MKIPTTSYDSITKNYVATIKWMSDIGVNIGSGRSRHYAKVIDCWKDAYKEATEREAKEIFPDFVNSVFEISDFIKIYEAFKNVAPEDLFSIRGKLQKGVSGPLRSEDEKPKSTVARNYIFEALVAARAHNPDSGVSAILNAESDTGVLFEDHKIWIECKRVTSINKIEANVRDASTQLERLLNKKHGYGHRGVIAIDITKILNENNKIYVRDNDQQLIDSTCQIMDSFINEFSNEWQKVFLKRSKKVIGIIIRFSFMASSESRGLLVHSSEWALNPRSGLKQNDEKVLRSFVDIIK